MTEGRRRWLVMAALFLGTTFVFRGALSNEFVSFDDPTYVTENALVRQGLTAEGVAWAFMGTAAANWHPLTWLSHMLDVQLFGLDAGAHHRTSVLLHAATAALFFLFLARATGRSGPAMVAALLFAVHPLRVESVVWIAERKDVLAAFFWMAALVAHERFVRSPARSRARACVGLALVLGLLAKPMVVSLPIVLLLCDVWPLERRREETWRSLLVEKIPWFLAAALLALVTLLVQSDAGAVRTADHIPLLVRLANGALAACTYLAQTVWPVGLSFHYPHPYLLEPGEAGALLAKGALAGAFLIAITIFAWRGRRARPWLAVGWAWYGVTLLPVIGLVQVGIQGHADRYTYLTTIGPVMAVVWMGAAAAGRSRRTAHVMNALAVVTIGFFAVRTSVQVETWRDSETLYRHALSIEPRNVTARVNLGSVLLEQDDVSGAVAEFQAALEIRSDHVLAGRNLGVALARSGQLEEAVQVLRRTLEHSPSDTETRAALGNVLARAGRMGEAQKELEGVLALAPGHAQALFDLAAVHASSGDLDRALELLRELLRLHPDHAAARALLQRVRERLGQ